MKLKKTINDIKSLKIQGAENVAIASIKALQGSFFSTKTHTPSALMYELLNTKSKLYKSRPTEPCMRNALEHIFHNIIKRKPEKFIFELDGRIKKTLKHFNDSKKKIAEIGAKRIKSGQIVFTHCHSTTVMDILKKAKKQGKKFEVHNTETRPLLQGQKTALELAKAGIKIKYFVDSAARIAMKKADLCLFGCDAVTTTKIYNKIGTEMFCEIAKNQQIPVFFCTDSWKFDPKSIFGEEEKIEMRNYKEIWNKKHKKIKICNPAFEMVNPELTTGIISELGVFSHTAFIEEVKSHYPWLFE